MTTPPGRGLDRVPAPALFVASGLTQYLGAAVAVGLFDRLPAATVAWTRVSVAAVVLVLWRRPWRTRWSRADLLPIAAFGVVLAGMNVSFYVAIAHLPLGTAVAIEFLGPVAVVAVTGRGWRERTAMGLAAAGVVLLAGVSVAGQHGSGAVIGLVAIVLAAGLWAGYIVLGQRVATRGGPGQGITSLGLAMAVGGLVLAPFLAAGARPVLHDLRLAGLVLAVAVFSSVVPYAVEQVVLRRVSTATFAILLALLPTTATAVGAVALRQLPNPLEVVGLVLVSCAIALTSATGSGPPRPRAAVEVATTRPPVRTGPRPAAARDRREAGADPGLGADRLAPMTWLTMPSHARWLEHETDRLLSFGAASALDAGGFARLDEAGAPVAGPAELWITCRMTHVYALGVLLGRPGSAPLVDHGLAALDGIFRDRENGGWFAEVGPDGAVDDAKAAYPHAFVILSTSSATAAGRPGARALLDEALAISSEHFWDDEAGMSVESWDRTFTELDGYRGVNANMHTVEAYLAAADVTGHRLWLDRALRVIERVVHGYARTNSWRIPEHFTADWQPDLEYNVDTPAHPFRPYGATIGHWLEWSRLTLHARAALTARGDVAPAWMLEDAIALFDAAVTEGWDVDGAPGFVYTVDWNGAPVVRERMHWVVAEGIAAASTLHAATGDERFDTWYATWWDYAARYLIDPVGGSWWHELGTDNQVSRTVWEGKADLYHAVQATLIPRLPLTPVLAPALAAGALD